MSGLGTEQWINENEASVPLNDGHVGDIEAANLIDPFGDLKQPMLQIQLPLPPETGMNRGRNVLRLQEMVGSKIPDGLTIGSLNSGIWQRRDKTSLNCLKIVSVLKGQGRKRALIRVPGRPGGVFGIISSQGWCLFTHAILLSESGVTLSFSRI
jgi:hypothetical protein